MGYDPTGTWDWGAFVDFVITAVSAIAAIAAGGVTSAATLATTKSPTVAKVSGTAAGIATFGAVNNGINSIYYNCISDGQSNIETNPDASSYTSRYISRWERLDYAKQETKEEQYNFDAWAFQSEYSIHMYGWFGTGWSLGKGLPVISGMAEDFQTAEVYPHELDPRPHGVLGTMIWGILGL